MKRTALFLLVLSALILAAIGCGKSNPAASAPTATAVNTASHTQTPASPTNTPTITQSATNSATASITATSSCTSTRTSTSTATATATITPKAYNINSTYPNCYDTMIYQVGGAALFNYGACDNMLVGGSSTTSSSQRSLIRYGITSYMLPGSKVVSGRLILYTHPISGALYSGRITAHKLLQGFTEGNFCETSSTTTCSWTNAGASAWTTAGGYFEAAESGSATFNASTIVTYIDLPGSLLQGWLDNDATNYGVLLKIDEAVTPLNSAMRFATSEYGNYYEHRLEWFYYAP